MQTSFEDIEALLRAEDIEGLIASGAPEDEYDSEAKQIASAVASLNANEFTQANITAIIALAWAKSFNQSEQEIKQRMPAFERISHILLLKE
jgi:hypothetical protein